MSANGLGGLWPHVSSCSSCTRANWPCWSASPAGQPASIPFTGQPLTSGVDKGHPGRAQPAPDSHLSIFLPTASTAAPREVVGLDAIAPLMRAFSLLSSFRNGRFSTVFLWPTCTIVQATCHCYQAVTDAFILYFPYFAITRSSSFLVIFQENLSRDM